MQPDSLSGGQDALKLKSRGGVVRVFKAAGYSLWPAVALIVGVWLRV